MKADWAINAVLFLFLYYPVIPQLVYVWVKEADYSHGFFIPLLSLYFLWRKKDELKNTVVHPDWIGLFLILAGLVFYMAAHLMYSPSLQGISMIPVLLGMVYTQAGKEMFKKTAFSIIYLGFMIPLPLIVYTQITFRLRLFATHMAFIVLKLIQIPATRKGNIITLPNCVLEVAAPCSGIRSLITFAAASLAIGYLFQKNNWKRAALFVFSLFLAVFMNIIRLVVTAVAAFTMKVHEVPASVHDTTGYVILILGFVLMFGFNDFMKKGFGKKT